MPADPPTYEELAEALEGMVWDTFSEGANVASGLVTPPEADALRLLARLGRVEIVEEHGSRVIARPVKEAR